MIAKLLKNDYIITFFMKVNVVLAGLFSTVFLNRALGPAVRGEYAYYLNIATISITVLGLGIIDQYLDYVKRKYANVEAVFFTFSTLQFLLLQLASVPLSFLLGNTNFFLLVEIILFSVYAAQVAHLVLVRSVRTRAMRVVLTSWLGAGLLALMYFSGTGNLQLALLLYLVKELLILVWSYLFCRPKFSFKFISCSVAWKLIRTGLLPMIATLASMINYNVDVLMLEHFGIPFDAIGLYAVGLSLVSYLWLFPDAFKEVLINRTAKSNAVHSITLSLRISMTVFACLFPIACILLRPLVETIYGRPFLGAANITLLLYPGVFSMTFANILGVLYRSNGQYRLFCFAYLAAAILNIGLNWVLIPILNIYGAAIASIVTYTLAGGIFLGTFLKEYDVRLRDVIFIRKDDITTIRSIVTRLLQAKQ